MGNRCCLPCRRNAKQGPSTRLIEANFRFESAPDVPAEPNPNHQFANNYVRTTKYSLLTFLPLNLWEQFHRFANVYFVFIVVLNFMPEVSAFAKELAPIPVLFVLSVTAIKDGFENYRRYKSDKKINHQSCRVYRQSKNCFVDEEWQNLWPGDIVRLHANEVIPADILLLHSSDTAGICYIETSNIDGETNLKQREVMRGLDLRQFNPETFTHTVEVEMPNTDIYRFDGSVRLNGKDNIVAIHKENLILRGCTIKNTDVLEGMVIYAGHETKAMLNNKGPRFKRSKLERQINKDVIWCVIILFVTCLFGAVGSGVWLSGFVTPETVIFLSLGNDTASSPAVQAIINFWTYIIIMQAMIPLSLYVTVEFVKLGQTIYITNDLDMYDEEKDIPAECRALNITEDLGQIQYVFSDKTGTLTENKMEFKRCSIMGHDYEHSPAQIQPQKRDSRTSINSQKPILDSTTKKKEQMFNNSVIDSPADDSGAPLTTLHASPMSGIRGELASMSFQPSSGDRQTLFDFFLVMSVCNSVVVSMNKNQSDPETTQSQPRLAAVSNKKKKSKKSKKKRRRGNSRDGDNGESDREQPRRRNGNDSETDTEATRLRQRHRRDDQTSAAVPEDAPDDVADPSTTRKKRRRSLSRQRGGLAELPPLGDGRATTTTANAGFSAPNDEVGTPVRGRAGRARRGRDGGDSGVEECRYSDSTLLESYVAESPDEAALVKTACEYGMKLVQRGPDFCSVWLPAQGHVTIEVLHVLPFDSDRKRMSVIVRHPVTGQVILLTKGADSAIFSRLKEEDSNDPSSDADRILLHTKLHLDQYALMGLRTLCLAIRYLGNEEYADWLAEFRRAERSIVGREEAVSRTIDQIEQQLQLLGVTGIEDRLQDGVPDTIASFRAAGINVWVLTGDKQETAIQISYSARLVTEAQRLLVLNADTLAQTEDKVRRYLQEIDCTYNPEYQIRQRRERPAIRDDLALVLDGGTLRHCLEDSLKFDFLFLAEQCGSVICCRATPSQKAAIVSLVKENLQMQTLAIGDGANDVNMIQTADIGIGLSGQEGMQAVMAADFALARFRFLKKLVLVHGHWCYDRLARMSLYLFYKNCVYIMMLFWFQLFNGFSGQVHIGQLYQVCFNLTMTALAPLIMGILDRHLRADILLANPILYSDAQNCRSYLPWHFWFNILDAVWQSMVIYFVPHLVIVNSDCDIWSFGDIVVSAGVITAVAHNALELRGWTGIHWFAIIGSPIVAWFGFALVLNVICTNCMHPDNPYYVIIRGVTTSQFWLPQLLIPFLALLPRLSVRAFRNTLRPNLTAQAMRLQSLPRHRANPHLPLQTPPKSFPGPPPSMSRVGSMRFPSAPALRRLSVAWLGSGGGGGSLSKRNSMAHPASQGGGAPDRSESASAVDIRAGSGRSRREFDSGSRHHKRSRSLGASQRIRRPSVSFVNAGGEGVTMATTVC
ncbi:hypothetical protein BOX15_Mlig005692g1 [Macrostomum lignano]|uniref:Phospholipid-transporting ATPase n=1 Tax=Macrostomum lignano TaxID=282301 RepID=A0A267F7U6_9PLAT|nr:hypothetical protein BOX15_Mlig005692g1 [Macrostomum lignano]